MPPTLCTSLLLFSHSHLASHFSIPPPTILLSLSLQVSREYIVECFLQKNPELRHVEEYRFEPHDEDSISAITKDSEADVILEKDAIEWVSQMMKHQMNIAKIQKEMEMWKSETAADTKVTGEGGAGEGRKGGEEEREGN